MTNRGRVFTDCFISSHDVSDHLDKLTRSFLPIALLFLVIVLIGCTAPSRTAGEIIIALEKEAFLMMKSPAHPEPLDTGITSLDVLNKKWQVEEMLPVFPDLHDEDQPAERYGLERIYLLRLTAKTNLEIVIREYVNNSHIEYAEFNDTFEGTWRHFHHDEST